MRMPLAFELNNDETLQVNALWEELSRFFPLITGLGKEENTKSEAYTLNLADFLLIQDKISLIGDKARERSLKHFASRHEELLTALKEEINNSLVELVTMEKSTLLSRLADPKSWRKNITDSFSPYLEILTDNERSEIIAYLNYAFNNREHLFRDAQKTATQAYESAKAKRVKKIIAPVDKVTQSIFNPSKNPALYEGGADLIVGRGRKEVTTAVSLRFEGLGELRTGTSLTDFHSALFNAVISHWLAGNTLITDNMLARAMTGKDTAEEKIILAIKSGMDTLIRTRAFIDATHEAKAFGLKGLENLKYEGALLDVRRITATINGQTLECYKIVAEPWLLTYAKSKDQLNTYDVRLLNAPFQAISATPENISVVSHLLNHIMAILNPNSRIRNIMLYEPLYQLAWIDATTEATLRVKRWRLRDTVHKILDVWTNEGLIDGYEDLDEDGKPVTNGKKTAKIKILCSVKKRKLSTKKKNYTSGKGVL